MTVDQTTGSYTLRIVVPNPDNLLLPGMYVRAVIQEGVADNAILVPQQGVSRSYKGEPYVLVVNKDNVVEEKFIKISRAMGNSWLVSSGLSAGERVIIEGMQKVKPGASVSVILKDVANAENISALQN